MTTNASKTLHPFERAGLGLAPFRFVGSHEEKYQACQGAPVQPGASCDYCGTAIMVVCVIQSSDGKRFKVGCDCVAKTYAECDVSMDRYSDASKLARQVAAAVRKMNTAKRHTREAAKISAGIAKLARLETRRNLRAQPHSRGFSGKTRLDEIRWMLKNAGNAGKIKTLAGI